MKKRNGIQLLVVVLMTILSTYSVLGQATQTAIVGSTWHYTVTQSMASGTSTYTWTNDATGAQATNTPAVLTSGLTNTVQVNWLATGTYHLTVLETSAAPHSCPDPGSAKTMTVTVVANTGTIAFTSASSGSCSGANATDLTLTNGLTFTGNITYPLVVNYTVNGTARTRTIAAGTATQATIALGSEDNILHNATQADVVNTVIITSASCSGATITVSAANKTYTYTAYGTPSTGGITAY